MISRTVVCVIIRIIGKVFFHRLSYGDYCRDREFTERGCTVWAKVPQMRVVRVDRQLDRLIIFVWQVNYCHRINRMAKEIFDRVQNLASPISGPSLEGIRKEKVRSSKNSLCTRAGDRTFCPLIWVQECIHAILASSNCGMSTRGFLQAEKLAPGRSGASRSENWEGKCDRNHRQLPNKLLSIFKSTHLESRLLQWLL